jgi:spermidine/putrescine transport system permease protein
LQVLRHALLPQILPGITAGMILVFLPATGQFVIPDLLGGAKTSMLGNVIQQQFASSRDWPFGAAIAFVALMLVAAGLWIYFRRGGREEEIL